MNDARKTATLASVALVLAVLTWATAPRSTTPNAFQDRGTSFFPGFTDPTMARSLEVVDFQEDTATAHPFRLQLKSGLWTIPSNDDYPADNIERLSNTVAAIIALKKDNVATDNVSEHQRTGTLDPLDETLPTLHGRGTRVTIKGDNDRLLADLVIGKPLEERPAFRYVRVADQARVYVAQVGHLDISTKFTDWIDPDLLKIQWDEVDQVIIRDYSRDRATRGVKLRDTFFIQKAGEDDEGRVRWVQREAPPGEQVDSFRANLVNTALDQLSIIGVRPKPPGLASGLTLTTGTLNVSQSDLSDLGSKGFYFTRQGQLLSDEGEVLVHTKLGIFFRLWFGDIAYGDVEGAETNTGATAVAGNKPSPATGARPTNKMSLEAGAKPATAKSSASVLNRYLIITVSFDPAQIPAGPTRDAAQKRAASLQARFAPWYYVISGQSFDQMRPPRPLLIKSKANAG